MYNYNTGVYQIVNRITRKRYIGSGKNLKRRKNDHFLLLRKNIHYNIHLQKSYNKYGKDNFNFEILLFCDKKNLIFYEQSIIDYYDFKNELYNLKPTADSWLGYNHSNKSKEKMRKAHKGKKLTEEHKKNISKATKGEKNPMYGLKGENHPASKYRHSEERKQKISKIHKGKIVSDETREKLSKLHIGKALTSKHKKKISDSLKKYYKEINEEKIK